MGRLKVYKSYRRNGPLRENLLQVFYGNTENSHPCAFEDVLMKLCLVVADIRRSSGQAKS